MQLVASTLTGVPSRALAVVIERLRSNTRRGRPWALSLDRRVVITCTSLRTNLTVRELAAVFGISRAQAHRIVCDIVARMAALALPVLADLDRRYAWVVDGTLIPTRDHRVARKMVVQCTGPRSSYGPPRDRGRWRRPRSSQ